MKSFAKINIFLKITGFRNNLHEISSRFVLFENLFDEIEVIQSAKNSDFVVNSNIKIKNNILNKAFFVLCKAGFEKKLKQFFEFHQISLIKNIPFGAGLGGGSSNVASFLKLINQKADLKIDDEKLMNLGAQIGCDVNFFLSGAKSANVSGVGEKILPFDDEISPLFVKTPDIFCDTKRVYEKFRSNFSGHFDINLAKKLENLTTAEILSSFKNTELNDLLLPSGEIYGFKLNENEFLSGSGSSFFGIKSKK